MFSVLKKTKKKTSILGNTG